MNLDKLYMIRTHGPAEGAADFYAGADVHGRQILLGRYHEESVCVSFDAQGELLEVQTRPLPPAELQALRTQKSRARQARKLPRRRLKPLASAWLEELGAQLGPIRVRRFMLPHHRIYISDYPTWAVILQADPFYYPFREERDRLRQQLVEWEESGHFVFWWRRDYFMSKDGEVLSP
jgi:hypothetical protein